MTLATCARNAPAFAAALAIVCAALGLGATVGEARAEDRITPEPEELVDLSVVERRGDTIPLDLEFEDEYGRRVTLGSYFEAGRPVVLVLGYYRCPMLCGLVMSGFVEGMKPLEWTPGQEFEIVYVSIDATETPELARQKKENYLKSYGRPSATSGWHFLTGEEPEIQALAAAVGFKYRFVEEKNEWAHPAVVTMLTPDGVISQYLHGVLFEPRTVRLSLVEASDGTIGNVLDQAILFCFVYNSKSGQYTPAVINLMKVGGVLTVAVLGIFLLILWRREPGRSAGRTPATTGAPQ